MRTYLRLLSAVALVCATAGSARAQSTPDTTDVNYPIDGAIIGISLAGAYLFTLMPVDTDRSWESELFGTFDQRLRGRFSKRAAKISDATLVLTVTTPMLEQLGRDVDGRTGERAMIYGQTFALNLAGTAAVKYIVKRPRPYTYSESESVVRYAADAGKDSHVSFYSGHASIAFSSAVAGSYLYAADSTSRAGKASAWLVNITLAAATANLRVRAGKHFYSDVVIGALIGSALGYAVPAFHAGDAGVYTPSALELGAIAGGVVLGTAASQLIPLGETGGTKMTLAPAMIKGGTGLAISGSLK